MGKSKRERVTDAATIEKLIDEYNKYVAEYNQFEVEQNENYINNKPFKIKVDYNGLIETVEPNGNSERSISISFKDNPNIVYTISVKCHGAWKSRNNFLKNTIENKNINGVWIETVDTWY